MPHPHLDLEAMKKADLANLILNSIKVESIAVQSGADAFYHRESSMLINLSEAQRKEIKEQFAKLKEKYQIEFDAKGVEGVIRDLKQYIAQRINEITGERNAGERALSNVSHRKKQYVIEAERKNFPALNNDQILLGACHAALRALIFNPNDITHTRESQAVELFHGRNPIYQNLLHEGSPFRCEGISNNNNLQQDLTYREVAAYVWLAACDAKNNPAEMTEGMSATEIDTASKENFIFALAEIRCAHNEEGLAGNEQDYPSCMPGTGGRLLKDAARFNNVVAEQGYKPEFIYSILEEFLFNKFEELEPQDREMICNFISNVVLGELEEEQKDFMYDFITKMKLPIVADLLFNYIKTNYRTFFDIIPDNKKNDVKETIFSLFKKIADSLSMKDLLEGGTDRNYEPASSELFSRFYNAGKKFKKENENEKIKTKFRDKTIELRRELKRYYLELKTLERLTYNDLIRHRLTANQMNNQNLFKTKMQNAYNEMYGGTGNTENNKKCYHLRLEQIIQSFLETFVEIERDVRDEQSSNLDLNELIKKIQSIDPSDIIINQLKNSLDTFEPLANVLLEYDKSYNFDYLLPTGPGISVANEYKSNNIRAWASNLLRIASQKFISGTYINGTYINDTYINDTRELERHLILMGKKGISLTEINNEMSKIVYELPHDNTLAERRTYILNTFQKILLGEINIDNDNREKLSDHQAYVSKFINELNTILSGVRDYHHQSSHQVNRGTDEEMSTSRRMDGAAYGFGPRNHQPTHTAPASTLAHVPPQMNTANQGEPRRTQSLQTYNLCSNNEGNTSHSVRQETLLTNTFFYLNCELSKIGIKASVDSFDDTSCNVVFSFLNFLETYENNNAMIKINLLIATNPELQLIKTTLHLSSNQHSSDSTSNFYYHFEAAREIKNCISVFFTNLTVILKTTLNYECSQNTYSTNSNDATYNSSREREQAQTSSTTTSQSTPDHHRNLDTEGNSSHSESQESSLTNSLISLNKELNKIGIEAKEFSRDNKNCIIQFSFLNSAGSNIQKTVNTMPNFNSLLKKVKTDSLLSIKDPFYNSDTFYFTFKDNNKPPDIEPRLSIFLLNLAELLSRRNNDDLTLDISSTNSNSDTLVPNIESEENDDMQERFDDVIEALIKKGSCPIVSTLPNNIGMNNEHLRIMNRAKLLNSLKLLIEYTNNNTNLELLQNIKKQIQNLIFSFDSIDQNHWINYSTTEISIKNIIKYCNQRNKTQHWNNHNVRSLYDLLTVVHIKKYIDEESQKIPDYLNYEFQYFVRHSDIPCIVDEKYSTYNMVRPFNIDNNKFVADQTLTIGEGPFFYDESDNNIGRFFDNTIFHEDPITTILIIGESNEGGHYKFEPVLLDPQCQNKYQNYQFTDFREIPSGQYYRKYQMSIAHKSNSQNKKSVNVIHIPIIHDFKSPTPEQIQKLAIPLAELAKLSKNIFAHCSGGYGRAPMIIFAMYLARHWSHYFGVNNFDPQRVANLWDCINATKRPGFIQTLEQLQCVTPLASAIHDQMLEMHQLHHQGKAVVEIKPKPLSSDPKLYAHLQGLSKLLGSDKIEEEKVNEYYQILLENDITFEFIESSNHDKNSQIENLLPSITSQDGRCLFDENDIPIMTSYLADSPDKVLYISLSWTGVIYRRGDKSFRITDEKLDTFLSNIIKSGNYDLVIFGCVSHCVQAGVGVDLANSTYEINSTEYINPKTLCFLNYRKKIEALVSKIQNELSSSRKKVLFKFDETLIPDYYKSITNNSLEVNEGETYRTAVKALEEVCTDHRTEVAAVEIDTTDHPTAPFIVTKQDIHYFNIQRVSLTYSKASITYLCVENKAVDIGAEKGVLCNIERFFSGENDFRQQLLPSNVTMILYHYMLHSDMRSPFHYSTIEGTGNTDKDILDTLEKLYKLIIPLESDNGYIICDEGIPNLLLDYIVNRDKRPTLRISGNLYSCFTSRRVRDNNNSHSSHGDFRHTNHQP